MVETVEVEVAPDMHVTCLNCTNAERYNMRDPVPL
jgi:RNase P subunit RPR2